MERKNNSFKFSFNNEEGIFYGYASVFNVVDSYDDIVVNGAFKNSLEEDKNIKNIKLCWQHNINNVIGEFLDIREDSIGLYVKGKIDINKNKKIYSLVKNNIINGLSIGYVVKDCYCDNKNRRVLTDLDLKEISIVGFPANKHSNILYCKSDNGLDELKSNIDRLIKVFS